MQIIVNGLLTNYELAGSGKLVLLLHGWGDSSKGLSGIFKDLSKQYKVIVLDLPGFGATDSPKDAWNLDNYAKFIRAFLDKLSIDQPFAVIGHSNGGALAIRAISLKLLAPKKLVLIAASGVRTGNTSRRFVLKIIAKTGNLATIWMPERYRQALRKSLYNSVGSDMLVAPHLKETYKEVVSQDVQDDAAKINIPALLIYATNDSAIPLSDGKKYQQMITGSKLEIIDGAGHFVHHDQPEKALELLKDFLK